MSLLYICIHLRVLKKEKEKKKSLFMCSLYVQNINIHSYYTLQSIIRANIYIFLAPVEEITRRGETERDRERQRETDRQTEIETERELEHCILQGL